MNAFINLIGLSETEMKSISGKHFAFLRVTLGFWFFIFFIRLWPDLYPILHVDGYYKELAHTSLRSINFSSNFQIDLYVIVMLSLSFMIIVGFLRKVVSCIFLLGWMILHYHSFLTPYPADGLLGWTLMMTLFIPSGEGYSLFCKKTHKDWFYPKALYEINWFIFIIAVLDSGIHKLGSPSWIAGDALYYIFSSPASYGEWRKDFLQVVGQSTLSKVNYSILMIEILFPVLTLIYRPLRRFFWIIFLISLLLFFTFLRVNEVVFGSIVCMLFLLDPDWIKARK